MGFEIGQLQPPTISGMGSLGPIVAASSGTTSQQTLTTSDRQIQQIFLSRLVEITCGFQYMGEVNPEGLPHGEGVARYPDGGVYIGSFKDSHRHGYGQYSFPNDGDSKKYIGNFSDGDFYNQGSFEFDNGDRLSGNIKDSQLEGTLIRWTGDIFSGLFEERSFKFIRGSIIYRDGDKTFIGEVERQAFAKISTKWYIKLWDDFTPIGCISVSNDGGKTVYQEKHESTLYGTHKTSQQKKATLVEILIHALHSGMYLPKTTT